MFCEGIHVVRVIADKFILATSTIEEQHCDADAARLGHAKCSLTHTAMTLSLNIALQLTQCAVMTRIRVVERVGS